MVSLYSTMEIIKALDDSKETISYYILKDKKYGLKITRALNGEIIENDEVIMQNITEDEKIIKELIDSLIKCQNDFSQIQYVVEDYLKTPAIASV